ncbi:MAG: trypsin-like peptidase domain-containing protein [Deltaproteobacteria bacterium]|nr:trypsin-like peptidase domain-containing protein [Deltaproteobacteria bacterium]
MVQHGTAFGFRRDKGSTYLLTNAHVVNWPPISDNEGARVAGIPAGCKRSSQSISIVTNEDDAYQDDDVPLRLVAVDEKLDAAILAGPKRLAIMPYRLGRSGAVRAGDAVFVRGYPLSAFEGVSTGKIVNPRDRDLEDEWQHWDIVISAPLSVGNSGSPVLAVTRAGRYELIGMQHAAYRGGQNLNVAVGIDDLRELMLTLKAPPARRAELSRKHRQQVVAWLGKRRRVYLPLGRRTVAATIAGDRISYQLFPKTFPLDNWPVMLLVDGKGGLGFGQLTKLAIQQSDGAAQDYDVQALAVETQRLVYALLRAIRWQIVRQADRAQLSTRRSRSDGEHRQMLERDVLRFGKRAERVAEQLGAALAARNVTAKPTAAKPTAAKPAEAKPAPGKPANAKPTTASPAPASAPPSKR